MQQYPDKVKITTDGESTQDANGNFVNGDENITEFSGRFEVNARSAFVIGNDGRRVEYKGMVYAPVSIGAVILGGSISVTRLDGTLITGKVEQFSRGQLNSRIWL